MNLLVNPNLTISELVVFTHAIVGSAVVLQTDYTVLADTTSVDLTVVVVFAAIGGVDQRELKRLLMAVNQVLLDVRYETDSVSSTDGHTTSLVSLVEVIGQVTNSVDGRHSIELVRTVVLNGILPIKQVEHRIRTTAELGSLHERTAVNYFANLVTVGEITVLNCVVDRVRLRDFVNKTDFKRVCHKLTHKLLCVTQTDLTVTVVRR